MPANKQLDEQLVKELNKQIKTVRNEKLAPPNDYHVLLLNDDYTTMEFVISVLIKFFNKRNDEAYKIMNQVHETGQGIAGTYTKEVAEAKCKQVMEAAKLSKFPLRCCVKAQ